MPEKRLLPSDGEQKRVAVRPDRRLLVALEQKAAKPLGRGHSLWYQVAINIPSEPYLRWVFEDELPQYRDMFVGRQMQAWEQLGVVASVHIEKRKCWRLTVPLKSVGNELPVVILET